jgi:hypothetical protein
MWDMLMKKLTTNEFVDNFYKRYTDGLNLDLTRFEYKTARTESITICKLHNVEIPNTANSLMQGIKKCKQCKSESISQAQSYTLDDFLSKSIKMHGDRYDYSDAVWVDSKTSLSIICKKHGVFLQNPQSHWNGYGCPKCGYGNLRKPVHDFINESNKIHRDRYFYENVDYTNNYTPVTIICKHHGEFSLSPKDHTIYQRGCPTCFPGNKSWAEISWLNEMKVPEECRQKTICISGKRFLVDAKIDNTIYEFWGDFWHGNPEKFNLSDRNTKCNKTFGELYEKTMAKRKMILDAGYDLVEIWESDFLKKT